LELVPKVIVGNFNYFNAVNPYILVKAFLPVIITSVVIGGVLGLFFTNPMLSVLLSSAGVKRLDFIIHLPIILMLCVGIFILAYIVSMFVSIKIRKITAYSLITE